jgi:hypothetical protein
MVVVRVSTTGTVTATSRSVNGRSKWQEFLDELAGVVTPDDMSRRFGNSGHSDTGTSLGGPFATYSSVARPADRR